MQKPKRMTIRDIAQAAGVSPATISLALNNKGNLPKERRSAIRALALKMGYVPNPMARALRGGSTSCIGVVINYFNNPFFRSLFAGLESAAEESGFAFTVSQSRDDLAREGSQARLLAERGMDGLIVLPCGKGMDHLKEIARVHNIPVVLISHRLDDTFATVEADNARGARLMARHFLELGRRCNLHLAGPQQKGGIALRKQGFCEVMQAHDPSFDPESHVFHTETLTAEGGFKAMAAMAARHPLPCSIFVVNDEVALGVLHYCRSHGLRVPEDVAVGGFSDLDILEAYGIPLTTVHIPARRMGEAALELLLEMKGNEKVRACPPVVTLPVNLVIRQSTSASGTM